MVKKPSASEGDTGDLGLIPGSERSRGGGHGNLPQYSSLEVLRADTGGLQLLGSHRVGHDLVTEQQGVIDHSIPHFDGPVNPGCWKNSIIYWIC